MFTIVSFGASCAAAGITFSCGCVAKVVDAVMPVIGYRMDAFDKSMDVFANVPLVHGAYTIAKAIHIAHFIFKKIEITQKVTYSPISQLVGVVAVTVDSATIEKAVKVAQVGRLLLNLLDHLKVLNETINAFCEELWCSVPSGHRFLAQEAAKRDYLTDIPYEVKLYQIAPDKLGEVVFRIRWIAKRLLDVGIECLNVSLALMDIQYALNCSVSTWDKFAFVDNVQGVFSQLATTEGTGLEWFIQGNESVFRAACVLLNYQDGEAILSCMQKTGGVVSSVIRSMLKTASVVRNTIGF